MNELIDRLLVMLPGPEQEALAAHLKQQAKELRLVIINAQAELPRNHWLQPDLRAALAYVDGQASEVRALGRPRSAKFDVFIPVSHEQALDTALRALVTAHDEEPSMLTPDLWMNARAVLAEKAQP